MIDHGHRGGTAVARAIVAMVVVISACGTSTMTATPSASPVVRPSPSPSLSKQYTPPCQIVPVRWFVGSGWGSSPADDQAVSERDFVNRYNAAHGCSQLSLSLEVVPEDEAYGVLKREIASGNAPDIIGPIGTVGLRGWEGTFMDLAPAMAAFGPDPHVYGPATLDLIRDGSASIGLPYTVDPGYIWYDKDLFENAGLPPLPTRVGQTYLGKTWDWNELADVAARLTLDGGGRSAADPAFDPTNIVQYGMAFQGADARRMASCFGAGSFLGPDLVTAQIPPVWRDAFNWYYDAIWQKHIIPAAAAPGSSYLGNGNAQATGHVAMNAAWSSSIGTIASDESTSKVKAWDIAVMPSWKGSTTSPADATTFVIPKTAQNPDAAYQAMLAIIGDGTLMAGFGGQPANRSLWTSYFERLDRSLAPIFPANTVTWSVLEQMQQVPAEPSQDADLPGAGSSIGDIEAFFARLQRSPGLSLDAELAALKITLQIDFDGSSGGGLK